MSKHQIQPENMKNGQDGAGRDGGTRLARQILRGERGKGNNVHFPCSPDHEQDWQPYPVDPYSAIISDDHTYIHTPSELKTLVLSPQH